MSTEIMESMGVQALEKVLINGDLSSLSPGDRLLYYTTLCKTLNLNPLARPFDYIVLNGKLTLYAKRDCTEQLRKINGVSLSITSRENDGECYIVTARAIDRTGRTDESTGVVTMSNLKGEQRSNAMMRAETKAKRRVTLSICGLGVLDETEISNIPQSAPIFENHQRLGFKEDEQEAIEDTLNHIHEVRKLLVSGKIDEAYSYCESLPLPLKKEVWGRLDTEERNLLKEYKTKE